MGPVRPCPWTGEPCDIWGEDWTHPIGDHCDTFCFTLTLSVDPTDLTLR